MSLKDFVVEKIMLCINRCTKNIPTQQKKSIEKNRGFTTFETEKIEWNQARLS